MACAAGILTARGGLASHAAVVARGWGIPAVVGASELEIGEDLIRLEGRTIAAGSVITIDGASGEVFEGQIAGSTQVVPEAATLLEWARELGVPVGEVEPEADPASRSAPVAAIREVTADDAVRALGTKGFATAQQLADALRSKPDAVQPILDQLVADELAVASAGAFRLTERGKARSSQLLATDRDAWGSEAANAALDAFLALDTRMKEAVTAWQLKAPDVVNDHADEAYDRGVLARLEELHADAVAWLIPIERACPRLGAYRPRLARALAEAIAGDPKYVASPRVDSYHGIWFELHEDLIQLAGRTREDEVAAGRA